METKGISLFGVYKLRPGDDFIKRRQHEKSFIKRLQTNHPRGPSIKKLNKLVIKKGEREGKRLGKREGGKGVTTEGPSPCTNSGEGSCCTEKNAKPSCPEGACPRDWKHSY